MSTISTAGWNDSPEYKSLNFPKNKQLRKCYRCQRDIYVQYVQLRSGIKRYMPINWSDDRLHRCNVTTLYLKDIL